VRKSRNVVEDGGEQKKETKEKQRVQKTSSKLRRIMIQGCTSEARGVGKVDPFLLLSPAQKSGANIPASKSSKREKKAKSIPEQTVELAMANNCPPPAPLSVPKKGVTGSRPSIDGIRGSGVDR